MRLLPIIVLCGLLAGCDAVIPLVAPTSVAAFRVTCESTVGRSLADAVAELKPHGGDTPTLNVVVSLAEKEGEWRVPRCQLFLTPEFRVKSGHLVNGEDTPRFAEACEAVPGRSVEDAVGALQDAGGGTAMLPRTVRVHHEPSADPGTPGGDDWSSNYCELTMDNDRNVASTRMGVSSFF